MDPASSSLLLATGLVVAGFVGVNVGGSSIGVAFGPATGSGAVSRRRAPVLMAAFVLLGAVTIGTRVVETLGTEFVPSASFSIGASIGVLLFTGLGVLVGNVLEVSVSTSETAVGAVVGMGAALGVVDWGLVGTVATWWLLSAALAFWVSAVVGRYLYDRVIARVDLPSGRRATVGHAVVGLGCYMAFSSGASNTASVVAPLVGAGRVDVLLAVVLGAVSIGIGGVLLGHRTMETVGEGITTLSVAASFVVSAIAATIVTALSWAGIPASLAITTTTSVIGLGWGRASRRPSREATLDLYDPRTARRIVSAWFATPVIAGGLSFAWFRIARLLHLI